MITPDSPPPAMPISWIEPGVLAASEMPFFPEDIRCLHAQGIRAILTLTEHPLTSLPGLTPELFTELDIRLFHVPVPDEAAPTEAQAREMLDCIHSAEKEKRPLLIHCMMGIGRTGTALHLYFLERGLSLDGARERVCERRKVCARLSPPQRAFLEQWAESYASSPPPDAEFSPVHPDEGGAGAAVVRFRD